MEYNANLDDKNNEMGNLNESPNHYVRQSNLELNLSHEGEDSFPSNKDVEKALTSNEVEAKVQNISLMDDIDLPEDQYKSDEKQ